MLTNHDALLPLTGTPKLYLQGVRQEAAVPYGQIVSDPAEADLAVVRLATPYEERPNRFESFFHSGDLAFSPAELAPLFDLMKTVPTLVCVNLERAAVLPEIAEHAAALLADFGASDTALLDVAFGHVTPQGRLPFELPRSMAAVAASREDVPNDTENPVFPAGHGLTL